jgi:multiple sugar transport system ATP-binding protein
MTSALNRPENRNPQENLQQSRLIGEGADVTTGIRPEDLFLSDDGPVTADVTHVEHLGSDTNVIAMMQDHQITARLFGQHQVVAGQTIRFGYEPSRVYRFDTDGARLG